MVVLAKRELVALFQTNLNLIVALKGFFTSLRSVQNDME
jgi:hypothetical protein